MGARLRFHGPELELEVQAAKLRFDPPGIVLQHPDEVGQLLVHPGANLLELLRSGVVLACRRRTSSAAMFRSRVVTALTRLPATPSRSQSAPGSPNGIPTLPALTTRVFPIVRSNCMWV